MKDKEKIYEKALKLWGFELQVNQTIQECAELIKVLSEHQRHKWKTLGDFYLSKDIIDELADVEIMVEQLKYYFSNKYLDFNKKFEEHKISKLRRVEEWTKEQ